MSDQAALYTPVTLLTAEAVVAAIVVALAVGLLCVVGYAVIVGSVAWVLVLVVELLRLGWASLCIAGMRLRRRLHRAHVTAVGLTTGPPRAGLLR